MTTLPSFLQDETNLGHGHLNTPHYCRWCICTYVGGIGMQMAMATSSPSPSKKCLEQKLCSPCNFGKGYKCNGKHDLEHCHPHLSLRQLVHIHIFGWNWCAHGGGYKFLSSKRKHVWDRSCVHHDILGRGTGAMDHIIWDIAILIPHYCKWCICTYLGEVGMQMAMAGSSPRKNMSGTEVVFTMPFGGGVQVPWTT